MQQQGDPSTWGWKRAEMEDNDSWEVRAFAEDTSSLLGTTWPPRSYTCAFCRREFRSAQALGGHMNVHRRDRARLRQSLSMSPDSSPSSALPALPVFSSPEFLTGGGICFFYQVPAGGAVFTPTASPTPFSNPPYPCNGLASSCSPPTEASQGESPGRNNKDDSSKADRNGEGGIEELDLELRLGW